MKHKNYRKILALILALSFTLSIVGTGVSAERSLGINSAEIQEKLTSELTEVLNNADKNDLIPIGIFRDAIDLDKVPELVYNETGKKPEIYESPKALRDYVDAAISQELNPARVNPLFDKEIASVVKKHLTDSRKILSAEELEKVADDIAFELSNAYFVERLAIVNREVKNSNKNFSKNIPSSREILHEGEYTGMFLLRATPKEIDFYASLPGVSSISFYDETLLPKDENLDFALSPNQTGAAEQRDSFGRNGHGVTIGVLEVSSRFNPNNPHIPFSFIRYVQNGNVVVPNPTGDNHATLVVSIIAGQPVTYNGRRIAGIVPGASVYQSNISNVSNMFDGFDLMANRYANIINCSFGFDSTSTAYDNIIDLGVDTFIANTRIAVVVSAGNNAGGYGNGANNVTSPAKALRAIAVGSLNTRTNYPPYMVSNFSSWQIDVNLPNKPDISAPGENIGIYSSANNGTLYSDSGTSFSAAIVTGIAAQYAQGRLISYTDGIKTCTVMSGIDNIFEGGSNGTTWVSGANNPLIESSMRERSGFGLVQAKSRDNYTFSTNFTNGNIDRQEYFSRGDKIRIVLKYGPNNPQPIATGGLYGYRDILDLHLLNSAGTTLRSNLSDMDNVKVIEYTAPSNGYYTIRVSAYSIVTGPVSFDVFLRWGP